MRRLTIERKNAIFKTLAISKIIYLTLVTNVATEIIINKPNEIQKKFIWSACDFRIKHTTLCKSYENGGLKYRYILSKINSL